MSAYTLSAHTNISGLSPARTGGDTINTNGYNFTIDQDTRYGVGGGAGFSFGSMTINATTGGEIIIDARAVRWIAYTGGGGNVPAYDTTITQSGQTGTGKFIGVWSSLTAAPTAPGSAMPATGWIKLRQVTGTYASGALSGITASSSGADTAGWIEVVGDESATINANRLGTVRILGDWFQIGTTNGSSNQTMQAPNNGTLRFLAGVYIETSVGSGTYEFWPNAGTTTTTGTESYRGKVVWIDNTGLVRIGNSGAATNGYTPVTGLKVVIPNIFLENCTTVTRTANVIPNATIATRYDFTCTGGGVVIIDKANCAWYGSFSQAYSVSINNSCFVDAILLSECASSISWSRVGVGNKPTTALVTQPLTITLCYSGGEISDSVFAMVSQGASGNHISTLTDNTGFTFTRCTFRANTIRGNATTYSINGTRLVNCTFTDCNIIQGSITLTTCSFITCTGLSYVDCVSGTTVTTYAMYVWNLASGTNNSTFSGLTFPGTNTHPYTAILLIAAAGCNNIKLRSIGTRASPLSLGSVNAVGLIYTLATGAAAYDIKIQRVYCSNTRTGIMTGDNSSTKVLAEQVFGDYADAADVSAILNFTQKGLGTTKALTAQTAVYGTHWIDYFTSTAVGRMAVVMNEPSSLTSSYVALSGGAAFTSAGGLYMPTIGQTAAFETPYYVLGHTSFQNSALVMAGGTAGNYTYAYQIDKNDGAGYSTWSAELSAANLGTTLNGVTGIDASKGFKLKLRITTSTTNTTAITSVYLLTNSSTTAQDYQYPLDTYTLTLTGLISGSDIVILDAGTVTERINVDANSGSTYAFIYSTTGNVDIKIYKQGYIPYSINNYPLGTSNASLPIAQVSDRNFSA